MEECPTARVPRPAAIAPCVPIALAPLPIAISDSFSDADSEPIATDLSAASALYPAATASSPA